MNDDDPLQGPDNDLALYLRGFTAPLWAVVTIATALLVVA